VVEELTLEVELLEEIIAPDLVEIEQNAVGQTYDYLRGYSQARKDIWATFEKIIASETVKDDRLNQIAYWTWQAKQHPEHAPYCLEAITNLETLIANQ